MITQKDIELLKETFVTKDDLKDQLRQLESRIMDKIEKFLAMFMNIDQEQTLLTEKVSRHSDELESHGKRLDHLEERHPVAS